MPAEGCADVRLYVASLGEDGDRLADGGVRREVIELRNRGNRDRLGVRRVPVIALGDPAVIEAKDPHDDRGEIPGHVDDTVTPAVGLPRRLLARARRDLMLVGLERHRECLAHLCHRPRGLHGPRRRVSLDDLKTMRGDELDNLRDVVVGGAVPGREVLAREAATLRTRGARVIREVRYRETVWSPSQDDAHRERLGRVCRTGDRGARRRTTLAALERDVISRYIWHVTPPFSKTTRCGRRYTWSPHRLRFVTASAQHLRLGQPGAQRASRPDSPDATSPSASTT